MKQALLTLGLALFAVTAEGQSLETSLKDCQAIAQADLKLACFERLADSVSQSEAGAPPSPANSAGAGTPDTLAGNPPVSPGPAIAAGQDEPAVNVATTPAPAPRSREELFPEPASKPSSYRATIRRAEHSPHGKLYVQLTNGEVWKQTSRGEFALPGPGTPVTVSRSALGAWFLDFDDIGDEIRMSLKR